MPTRFVVLVTVLLAALFTRRAGADIAPGPSCQSGEHHQYLRGYHCVKDGFMLVDSSDLSGFKTVADPSATPPAKPSAPAAKSGGCASTPVEAVFLPGALALLRRRSRGSIGD
jgi:hypothetical protein